MTATMTALRNAALGVGFGVMAARTLRRHRRAPKGLPGHKKRLRTVILELGARAFQRKTPLKRFGLHLVGLHPMKDDASHQMIAHHFCDQVNEDFMQCVIFDGEGPGARLCGVEYIISEQLFEDLPEDEKRFWHPHNYEILSGQLVAPRLPERLEREKMRRKVNSYGKTWHFWMTESAEREGDNLPLGEPCLMWSLNRDGEADPDLLRTHEQAVGIDSPSRRGSRRSLQSRAHPQRGVNVLAGKFGRETRTPAGVSEAPASH